MTGTRRATATAVRSRRVATTPETPSPRAPRRDAARNYARVLDAARQVLGELGTDASMEQIASRAGVGVGTVYRRFPSKDALIDELIKLVMDDLTAAAREALADDDGTGLEQLLQVIGRSFAEHRRYAGLVLGRSGVDVGVRQLRTKLGQLLDNARGAGRVAEEVTLGDVMALIWSLRGLVEATGEVAPDAWERHLDIHLAGMRSTGPLSSVAPLTTRQLSRLSPIARRPGS